MHSILEFLNRWWLFIVIGILGSSWFLYTRWKTREKMQKLAKEMGIVYSTGADELLGIFSKNQGARTKNKNGLVTFLGLFASWRLDGKINGVPVSVYPIAERLTDEKTQRCTLLKATFDPPLRHGLLVARRQSSSIPGFVTKIASKLLPRSEERIEVLSSNEILDKKVVIHAKSAEEIRSLCADPAVQEQMLRVMELEGGVSITDNGVAVIRGRDFSDAEKVRSILHALSATVNLLQSRIQDKAR